MHNCILMETLAFLSRYERSLPRRVKTVRLTRYYTIVELEDGSVGAAMSYYFLSSATLARTEAEIFSAIGKDALTVRDSVALQNTVAKAVSETRERYFLTTAVIAAVTSALSAPIVRQGGDDVFRVVGRPPDGWTDTVEEAVVIGFPGYFPRLAGAPSVKRLHIVDLYYDRKQAEIDAAIAQYARLGKTVTVSGRIASPDLKRYDLVSITGSALCNGSLEELIEGKRPGATVILQGQSANIHPKVLFERGVSWVATTGKPKGISEMTVANYGGRALKTLFERGLPYSYYIPARSIGAIAEMPSC